MSKGPELFYPKLFKGMIAPSGKQFVYQIEGKEIELPFAMADLVLLCDGQHSLYQILVKIHEKQGVVHFKKVIDTLILLFDQGFIENDHETLPLIIQLKRLLNESSPIKDKMLSYFESFMKRRMRNGVFLKSDIKERIQRNSFFSELTEEQLDEVVNECEVILYSKGQTVIALDEPPKDIYYLIEGECRAHSPGFSGTIHGGSFFGEGALREVASRAAAVEATKASQILRIPVQALKAAALHSTHLETLRNQIIVSQFFRSSPHFQGVESDTIERLERAGRLEIVDAEHTVFEFGELSNGIYFLVRGSVRVEVGDEKVVTLDQGELFGEISVMAKLPRTAKVITKEPCFLFKVSLEAFWEVLLSDLGFAYRIEKLCEKRLSDDLEILQRKSQQAG